MNSLFKKKILVIVLSILLIGCGVFWISAQKESQIILMKNGSFEPSQLTVKVGSKVIFKNADDSQHWPASDFHPTHGIYPEFDSLEGIEPNSEWAFTFKNEGKWRFHDHLVPTMRGTIVVAENK